MDDTSLTEKLMDLIQEQIATKKLSNQGVYEVLNDLRDSVDKALDNLDAQIENEVNEEADAIDDMFENIHESQYD